MEPHLGALIANRRLQCPEAAPRLKLLVELEPRHRVFVRNLADLLLSRPVPHIAIGSRRVPFWDDVFVPSGIPWASFLESMLWHLVLIVLFVLGQSKQWMPERRFPVRDALRASIHSYLRISSFPALGGRAPGVRARSRVKHISAQPSAIPVRPQQKPRMVSPPDIKPVTARLPNLPDPHAVGPMVPLSAIPGPRWNAWVRPYSAVAPSPKVDQATARWVPLPQASAVSPAPDLGGTPTAGATKAPGMAALLAVPPPPSAQDVGNTRKAESHSPLRDTGANVVPPSPSLQDTSSASAEARPRFMAPEGSPVIPPPPPSAQDVGNTRKAESHNPLRDTGANVVPPSPSLQDTSSASAEARPRFMAPEGSPVIPPPPSIQTLGNPALARPAELRSDSQVMPPPRAIENSGGLGGENRFGSHSDANSDIVAHSGSIEAAGNSSASGPATATGSRSVVAASSPPPVHRENKPTIEQLPLDFIGLVLALPGTSFFSDFEVFVAKRLVAKDQLQLIKLVYEFLPYQRRLSEYNLNDLAPRIIKLRVTWDPSCDESLGQMIHTRPDPTRPATEYSRIPAALLSTDQNAVLPCYRTTADDFEKAMLRAR